MIETEENIEDSKGNIIKGNLYFGDNYPAINA